MRQAIESNRKNGESEPGGSSGRSVYMCTICGWLYDEADGLPQAGIPPGTRWEDVPEDFICPECSEGKDIFEKIDI